MVTVALIGPDGAGKSTLARLLVERLPVPAVTFYMGVNPTESAIRSPLARLASRVGGRRGVPHDAGPPARPSEGGGPPAGLWARSAAAARSVARAAVLIVDERHRQRRIAAHRREGRLVILDRDFWADYRMHDVEATSARTIGRRLHGMFLERWYRKPDLFVYLAAPAETLLARKGEGTVELLRARQADYLRLAPHAPRFEVLDVDRPIDEVLADLHDLVDHVRRGEPPA